MWNLTIIVTLWKGVMGIGMGRPGNCITHGDKWENIKQVVLRFYSPENGLETFISYFQHLCVFRYARHDFHCMSSKYGSKMFFSISTRRLIEKYLYNFSFILIEELEILRREPQKLGELFLFLFITKKSGVWDTCWCTWFYLNNK